MQNDRFVATLIALPLGLAAAGVSAQDLTKEELATRLNGVTAADISDSPLPGIYQVAIGAQVAYVTKDGRYIIRGDIYDADSSANVSEETRARARVSMLESVDPASMIVFKPASGEVKHKITIFTDIDCGYCRQFHREIDKVTALGIEVHYLFYPAHGPEYRVVDQGRPSLVRAEPQLGADSRQARRRDPRGAGLQFARRGALRARSPDRRARHAGDLLRDRRAHRRLPAAGDTRQGARRPERDHRRIVRS